MHRLKARIPELDARCTICPATQMRQKEEMDRLKAEQITYSRINALSRDYVCIYTVNPVTGKILFDPALNEGWSSDTNNSMYIE